MGPKQYEGVTALFFFRELLFGEHDMGSRGHDCDNTGQCLPLPQTRYPAPGRKGIIVHEDWDQNNFREGNDIALIRLDRPVDTIVVSLKTQLYKKGS